MDFFSAQDAARRKTWQLAALFSAAVITLIVLTNLLLAFAALWIAPSTALSLANYGALESIPWETWAMISTGVIGVVACATVYKFLMVRGGGKTIAESLGGTRLTHATATDLQSKRLLNIVEEMAIASGTPVPPVYLIPEPSINAFAAGFTLDDAVIGINRGTIDALSRDELQGVVAHEFSHILNGDMRINLRLIAVLHGILFLGMIGYGILRGGVHVRGGRDRDGLGPLMIVAIGLVIIGYGGTFFGKWIKAAVSRQREYLADAAAVQFTRNPDGIGGALKKIGGSTYGSAIAQPAAEEASHLFFGDVLVRRLGGVFATHPPLDKRIRAIDPNWDGKFLTSATSASTHAPTPGVAAFAGAPTADSVVASIGETDAEALDEAQRLMDSMQGELLDAAHDGFTARALVYAMLIGNGEVAEHQVQHIHAHAEPGVPQSLARLQQAVADRDAVQRITLLELCVPTLKALSTAQYERFMDNVRALIKADARIDIFEWVLFQILSKELKAHFETVRPPRVRYKTIAAAATPVGKVLAAVAAVTHDNEAQRLDALNVARGQLELELLSHFPDIELNDLNRALRELRALRPLRKPAVLKAASSIVTAQLAAEPAALLHGVAAALDCPLPLAALTRNDAHG